MVSLEESKSPRGGFSFERTSAARIQNDPDENLTNNQPDFSRMNDTMPLTTSVEPNFRKIRTTVAICLQILFVKLFLVGVFLLPLVCDSENIDLTAHDLIIYIHSGFWLLKFAFDRFYQHQHMVSKRNGYLDFYRQTRLIRSLPLLVISFGSSVLLVLERVLILYCPAKCTTLNLTAENFLQGFVTLECLALLPILYYYLRITYRFNSDCKGPDINSETERPLFQIDSLNDIGYKDSSYLRNVLENQADMIRYLQERNKNLIKKLYNIKELPQQANVSGANISNISIN